jgi:hypothetical protein
MSTTPDRREHSSTVPIAVEAAVMVFCWSFAFLLLHPMPTLWYYPLEHRWAWETHSTGFAMDWYGRTLVSIMVAGLGGAMSWGILRRRAPLSPEIQDGWMGALVVSIVFVVLVIVVTSLGRHPVPEPLPPWYEPR